MTPALRILALAAAASSFALAIDFSAVVGANKPYLDERAGFIRGGSVRFALTDRFAVRPEILYSSIPYYNHLFGLASFTYDFASPGPRAVGYVVGSIGAVRSREDYYFRNSNLGWLGGVGVRFRLPAQCTGSAEFRIGPAAIPMTTFSVGYTWKPQK